MRITNRMFLEATKQEILEAMWQGFASVDQRFEKMDQRFDKMDLKFEDLTVMVVNRDHRMKDFLTRSEFEIYKEDNAARHDATAARLDYLVQEFKAFNAAHSRLEDRVDIHEDVLVRNGLMSLAD